MMKLLISAFALALAAPAALAQSTTAQDAEAFVQTQRASGLPQSH
jgi:phospholipid transport system substrate-binding protein